MVKYVVRKVLTAFLVIFIVTIFCYGILELIPGDLASMMLGTEATEADIIAFKARYNLDKPFLVQYFNWFKNLLKGDLGYTPYYHQEVTAVIATKIPVTFYIGGVSLVFSIIFGVLFGIIAAVKRGSWVDNLINITSDIGIAAPSFWYGILLVLVLALTLKILPVQGYTSPFKDLGRSLVSITIPCLVISFGSLASITRQTRAAVLEAINQDFVRTARSKGLKERVILLKHVLRNALIPVLTLLGMQIRMLFGGSLVIEQMFGIPGMGRIMVEAVKNRDPFVLQGCMVVMSVVVVASNLLVDIAYGLVDPRIREKEGK